MQGLMNRENLVTPLFPVKLFGSALYVRNKGWEKQKRQT